jgi:outer membrane protein assembly factor BamB
MNFRRRAAARSGRWILKKALFSFLCGFLFTAEIPAQRIVREPIWRQALGGAVLGPPSVQAETVTVVCEGHALKVYSRFGNLLWSHFVRGQLTPYVSQSPEGISYICRINGLFLAINRSGRELWRVDLKAPVIAPALIGWDGRVFVTTEKKIVCYTAAGSLLWTYTLKEKPVLGPLPDKRGGVFMAFNSGELLSLDAFGRYFRRPLREAPAALVVLDLSYSEGYVLAGRDESGPVSTIREGGQGYFVVYPGGETVLVREDGGISSFPALNGGLPARIRAGASRGDRAAFVLANGDLLLVEGPKGRVIWTVKSHISQNTGTAPGTEAGDNTALIFDERGIYVLTRDGASGFAEDGRQLWTVGFQEAAALPALSDDGILYAGSKDWILSAYRAEERVRTRRYFIFGPAPEGSYGTGNPPPSPWADDLFRYEDDTIQKRLRLITKAVRNGQVGGQELAYTAYLMELIQSTGDTPGKELNTHPLVQISRRLEALHLLGSIGSRESIPFLARIFSVDQEPLIQAAAAEAIGRIGVDPEGIALGAFAAQISPQGGVNRDDRTLAAIAAAAGALCRFSGPPLSETGVRLLTLIAGGNDIPRARHAARQELDTLKQR